MSEQALQEQIQQAHRSKKENAQLTTRYKKYLSRSLSSLSTATNAVGPSYGTGQATDSGNNDKGLETPLSQKVEVIYTNQTQLARQKDLIESKARKMDSLVKKLDARLQHTREKMEKSGLVEFEDGEMVDVIQRRAEKVDQSIRILESCMRMVETNGVAPAVGKRRGLFG